MPLLRELIEIKDSEGEKITLTCPKCKAVGPSATSAVYMALGWRRLRYRLANGPMTFPICPACRKAVTK